MQNHHANENNKPLCPNDSTSTTSSNSSSSEDIDAADLTENEDITFEKGLCSLFPIKKGELVAKFLQSIDPSCHFIRNSLTPNCIVIDGNVYANEDIAEEIELTINYTSLC